MLNLLQLLALLLAPSPAPAVVLERLEANVNSQIILLSDVVQFRKSLKLRGQLDPLFSGTPLAAKGDSATDAEIVDFLINEKMILQEFTVSDADIEQEINSIQSNNRISRTALKAALRTQGFTYEQYFELIRISLAKRNLIDRDIRTKVVISDEDVLNQMNLKGQTAQIPSAYRIRMIAVYPQNYKKRSDARAVIQQAYDALRAGESFDAVARRLSEDPSGSSGGDLGFLADDELSPELKKVVTRLKVGEHSTIQGSEKSSFFITKVEEIKTKLEDRMSQAKEEIRAQLGATEYQRQIVLWLERQRQKSFISLAGKPLLQK
jgi:peptidyl-prolyl cis-trans isomerase SurA